jgi:hypothetical protein
MYDILEREKLKQNQYFSGIRWKGRRITREAQRNYMAVELLSTILSWCTNVDMQLPKPTEWTRPRVNLM